MAIQAKYQYVKRYIIHNNEKKGLEVSFNFQPQSANRFILNI
jgi:hypothetical protein